MSITKISKSVMEVTADYQKLSDLNVAFYNQDINTSILQFNVTRNDAVVPLGKTNVDGYIVLLHEDGSRIQDNLVIVNEEHGVIQYTIPREFLKHTGKVLGQVYITVKGRDDTAVMRKISLEIKQDLLTGFSSTKKLEYIKTFDDLKEQIKQRVKAIEEAIAHGEDYATAMEKAAEKGQKDIQAVATKATTDVNKASTDATKKITDTSNTAVATVNAKGDAVLKAFSENGQVPKITADTGSPRYDLNATKDLFAEILTWGNGFFTFFLSAGATNNPTGTKSWLRGRTSTYGKNSDVLAYDKDGAMYIVVCANGIWGSWDKTAMSSKTQNSKITNDDGSSITVSGYDLLDVEDVKNYDGYVTTASNVPTTSNSGYFKRKYRSGYIEITFSPHSTKGVYRNSYNSAIKSWVGWEKMVTSSELASAIGSNTGWLPLPLLNGVTASTPCFYRFYSTNGIYYLSFKGVLKTLSTRDVTIAKLPEDVATKIDRALTWVGNTSLTANTARFNRLAIEADGTIKFTASSFGTNGESGAWNPLDVTLTL